MQPRIPSTKELEMFLTDLRIALGDDYYPRSRAVLPDWPGWEMYGDQDTHTIEKLRHAYSQHEADHGYLQKLVLSSVLTKLPLDIKRTVLLMELLHTMLPSVVNESPIMTLVFATTSCDSTTQPLLLRMLVQRFLRWEVRSTVAPGVWRDVAQHIELWSGVQPLFQYVQAYCDLPPEDRKAIWEMIYDRVEEEGDTLREHGQDPEVVKNWLNAIRD